MEKIPSAPRGAGSLFPATKESFASTFCAFRPLFGSAAAL